MIGNFFLNILTFVGKKSYVNCRLSFCPKANIANLQIGRPILVSNLVSVLKSVLPNLYSMLQRLPVEAVSILGFENCQSFFSATSHVRCTAPADAVRHIAYFIGKTALRSSSAYNMRATV